MKAPDSNLLEPSQPPNGSKLKPCHPGRILRNIVLPGTGWSVSEMARRLGISRQHLQGILATERRVTPEVAVRIGTLFNTSHEMWLNMQTAYDLRQAQKALRKEIPRISAAGKELAGKTDVEYRQAA